MRWRSNASSATIDLLRGGHGVRRIARSGAPTAVAVIDAHIDVSKTADLLQKAHDAAVGSGTATLIHQLAVPFVGMEGQNATDTSRLRSCRA